MVLKPRENFILIAKKNLIKNMEKKMKRLGLTMILILKCLRKWMRRKLDMVKKKIMERRMAVERILVVKEILRKLNKYNKVSISY